MFLNSRMFMPTFGFSGFKLQTDLIPTRVHVSDRLKLPTITTPNANTSNEACPAEPGCLAYDPTVEGVYYSNGLQWIKLSTGSSGNTIGYSFIKGANLTIPNNTPTDIIGWTAVGSSAYSTYLDWNLATGVFTASIAENVSFHANITWASGISTIGSRVVQIQFKPAAGVWGIIKEQVTQPDPNVDIATTQEIAMNAELGIGDMVKIVCYQDSGVAATLQGGIATSVCGFVATL